MIRLNQLHSTQGWPFRGLARGLLNPNLEQQPPDFVYQGTPGVTLPADTRFGVWKSFDVDWADLNRHFQHTDSSR